MQRDLPGHEHEDVREELEQLHPGLMNRHDDAVSVLHELFQARDDLERARRVQPARGLVEEEHLGGVQQQARDADAALLPAAETPARDVQERAHPHRGDALRHPLVASTLLQAELPRRRAEVIPDRERLRVALELTHVPDLPEVRGGEIVVWDAEDGEVPGELPEIASSRAHLTTGRSTRNTLLAISCRGSSFTAIEKGGIDAIE